MFSVVGKASLAAAVAMPIAAFLAIGAAGGGHGTYYLAKVLYPYTMASTAFTGSIATPFIVLGLAQYLAYGLVLDRARFTNRFRHCALFIVAIHAVFVFLAFSISDRSFTP